MKKFLVAMLLILAVLSPFALAESDLAAMSDDELYQLRDAIDRELASRTSAGDVLGTWDTSVAHVELLEVHAGKTFDGKPGVVLIFSYTNTGSEIDSFSSSIYTKVFANGIQADIAVMIDDYILGDSSLDVMPGASLQRVPLLYSFREEADSIDVYIIDCSSYEYVELGHLTLSLAG